MIYAGFIKGNLPKIMDKGQIRPCRPPDLNPVTSATYLRQPGFLNHPGISGDASPARFT
jgi:hypothetical protein